MSPPARKTRFDADAYLAWEAAQPEKHEYLAGEVLAMPGASAAHVTVALNLTVALRTHLRDGPYSVFTSDMKLHCAAADAFFYPDVFVSSAAEDRRQAPYKTAPILIAEVLAPATSAYDRGAKFAAYRKFASLREYLLIDPERIAADLFRRDGDGHWLLHPHADVRRELHLQSVDLRLPLADLYADVPGAEQTLARPV